MTCRMELCERWTGEGDVCPCAADGTQACTCPRGYRSLGVLYGISMGHDWVRLSTDPTCPCHGTGAR